MHPIDDLIQSDRDSARRILICGDALDDVYVWGESNGCQEGVVCLKEWGRVSVPGGAANAARSLVHWSGQAQLVAALDYRRRDGDDKNWLHIDDDLLCAGTPTMPVKTRFVDEGGRIVFRHDDEETGYGISEPDMGAVREAALEVIRTYEASAVLICDYMKGFLNEAMIDLIITHCQNSGIPVVCDVKRYPSAYEGAILKANGNYFLRWINELDNWSPSAVVTYGAEPPILFGEECPGGIDFNGSPVVCVNHVGAGDCFSAHLTLALAHGLPIDKAAQIAHAAGRVYVQHPSNRPPWPHEVRRDLLGNTGKVVTDAGALRLSLAGQKVVFTNGVFRIPHAGHAWFLDWAKKQGDVLVVGVNDDVSAAAVKFDEFCLPLAERLEILSSFTQVDWIVPFPEASPCAIIEALEPGVLVKGSEYAGGKVPGDDLVEDVRFAPPGGPFPGHASDLVGAIKGGS